jgi:hypothetical protein
MPKSTSLSFQLHSCDTLEDTSSNCGERAGNSRYWGWGGGVGGGARHREETSCTPGDSFPLQNKYSKRAKL